MFSCTDLIKDVFHLRNICLYNGSKQKTFCFFNKSRTAFLQSLLVLGPPCTNFCISSYFPQKVWTKGQQIKYKWYSKRKFYDVSIYIVLWDPLERRIDSSRLVEQCISNSFDLGGPFANLQIQYSKNLGSYFAFLSFDFYLKCT